tara:strand:- start:55 stop:225 length:171 start_codon:yes stop_codon:yes gene_type:complete
MKLSTKIKLEYWQAVTTGAMITGATLEAMLSEALDEMEEEINNNPSCKGILDNSDQ